MEEELAEKQCAMNEVELVHTQQVQDVHAMTELRTNLLREELDNSSKRVALLVSSLFVCLLEGVRGKVDSLMFCFVFFDFDFDSILLCFTAAHAQK